MAWRPRAKSQSCDSVLGQGLARSGKNTACQEARNALDDSDPVHNITPAFAEGAAV